MAKKRLSKAIREMVEEEAFRLEMTVEEYQNRYMEAELSEKQKWGVGQAQLRGMQGLAELGNALGKALPDTPTQDVPGVVMPTPSEVNELKNPEPQTAEPEMDM